jgi:hypothetical protein
LVAWLVALPDVRLVQHHPHPLPVLQFAQGIDAPVVTTHAPRRLFGHRDFGDQVADGRGPSREVDAGFLADEAATAVASDQILRSQRTAAGQLDVDADVVLRETCHLDSAIDRYRQFLDPRRQRALDALLR